MGLQMADARGPASEDRINAACAWGTSSPQMPVTTQRHSGPADTARPSASTRTRLVARLPTSSSSHTPRPRSLALPDLERENQARQVAGGKALVTQRPVHTQLRFLLGSISETSVTFPRSQLA